MPPGNCREHFIVSHNELCFCRRRAILPLGERVKPGRNDPCPCGSGLKFKRCCLNVAETKQPHSAQLENHPALRLQRMPANTASADSLSHVIRKPPAVNVAAGRISVGDYIEDPDLVRAYAPFQSGRHPAAVTRIPIGKLSPEFVVDGRT